MYMCVVAQPKTTHWGEETKKTVFAFNKVYARAFDRVLKLDYLGEATPFVFSMGVYPLYGVGKLGFILNNVVLLFVS